MSDELTGKSESPEPAGASGVAGEQRDVAELREKWFRANASSMVCWEAIWGIGAPCCVFFSVVPGYLLSLGASRMLIQSVIMAFSVGAVLQLMGAKVAHGASRKMRIFLIWAGFTVAWLAYGVTALFMWPLFPTGFWIVLFVIMCLVLTVLAHLGTPGWNGMTIENTPVKKRGRVGAMRMAAIGVTGLVGARMAAALMGRWHEPLNFHICFVVGSVIMFVSCFSILAFRDVAQESREESDPPSLSVIFGAAKHLATNFNFRVFLVFYSLLVAAQSLGPLLISYGKDIVGMESAEVAWFSAAFFLGPIIVGTIALPLADRFGFKLVAQLGALAMITSFVMTLVMGGTVKVLLVAYAFCVGSVMLNGVVAPNFGTELVPEVSPMLIVGVGNAMAVPVGLVVGPFGGWLVDSYGAAGYLAAFIMGITLAACAMLGFSTVLVEPRSGREIYVRIRRV